MIRYITLVFHRRAACVRPMPMTFPTLICRSASWIGLPVATASGSRIGRGSLLFDVAPTLSVGNLMTPLHRSFALAILALPLVGCGSQATPPPPTPQDQEKMQRDAMKTLSNPNKGVEKLAPTKD